MPIPISNIVLNSDQLDELEKKHPWVSATITWLQKDTRGATVTVLDTPSLETTKEIDYNQLATKHAELIAKGRTSIEIAEWIGDKLNIASWKAGEFYGERKVLSSPKTPAETERLQKFVEALKVPFSKANQSSQNHSQYLLLDGYVQNALFGKANMEKVDETLKTFDVYWKGMWEDFIQKQQYLVEKIGLDIKWDWSKLTGLCYADGVFVYSDSLVVSGSLDVDDVLRFWLTQNSSDIFLFNASNARLCFLT